jgi:hypothetical protein
MEQNDKKEVDPVADALRRSLAAIQDDTGLEPRKFQRITFRLDVLWCEKDRDVVFLDENNADRTRPITDTYKGKTYAVCTMQCDEVLFCDVFLMCNRNEGVLSVGW